MKYYVYISTLKVNMLFDQIPIRIRQKIASEVKLDLKVFSATFKSVSNLETTISKLNLIAKVLELENKIGTVSNPKEYFAGEMNMGWGPLNFNQRIRSDFKLRRYGDGIKSLLEKRMVIFGGLESNGVVVALVGSKAHMIGEVGDPVHCFYIAPVFFKSIANAIKSSPLSPNGHQVSETCQMLEELVKYGGTSRVQFVAKTYVFEQSLLLGSPLYVAFANGQNQEDLFKYYC
jgi:hypothetical protein